MTYDNIRTAAEKRQSGESTGAWALADALLDEVPADQLGRNQYTEGSGDVPTTLATIAARLTDDGIETPNGNPYEVDSLRVLRLVAMGWPKPLRLREAAFRTHQEAGSSNEHKREALRVLCIAARTGDYSLPPMNHGELEPASWQLAVASIQRKVASGMRYPVSANDLRIARQVKTNVPERSEKGTTVLDAIESMQRANEYMVDGVRVLTREGLQLGDAREALEGLLQRMRACLDVIDSLLTEGGVTDAALERFLAGES